MKYTSNITHRGNLVLSFKFWLVTVLLLLIYSSMLFAQYTNTVYLDPTNEGDPDQDGTIDHPFDSWDDVRTNLQSNTAYLQKRGTTEYRSGSVVTIDGGGLHDIKFGNYGTGERPVIAFNAGPNGFYFKRTTRMVVDGLELYGNYDNNGNFSGQAIYLSGHTSGTVNTTQITIQNCKMHRWGGGMALLDFSTKIDSITIDNCEIFHISEDGVFGNVDNFTCKNSHIYKVNRKFHTIGHSQQQSGGDGIQINGDNFLILNNIIDRSWTGNKFCFILGNAYSRLGLSGKILWNTFIPPKDTIDDDGGCCIYMAYTAKVDVGYNTFVGTGFAPDRAAASVGVFFVDTVNFYYNVLDSMNKVIITDQPPLSIPDKEINVYNNTILHTYIPLYPVFHASSDVIHGRNNIFAIEPGIEPFLYYYGNMDTSNNIYVTTNSQDNWDVYPGFVDWENQNYRLRETSPAINTGVNYAGWLCDIDSVAVPQQSIRDKGTYEYSEGGTSNNPPSISNQGFDIEENTANGTIVGIIEASDPDQGQTLTYSIQSGNINNAFQINTSTGSLTVNNSDLLNFELNPVYSLVVMVQDNGPGNLTAQATITVNLLDINEVPEIDDQIFSLDENSPFNQEIGMVQASDPDIGQSLEYTILSGNSDDAFTLNLNSGRLSVNNSTVINFELNPQYNLSVQVQDNGSGQLTNQAIITINIADVNEPPTIANQEFTVQIDIHNIEADISNNILTLGDIQASDPDNGQNVTFQILSGDDKDAFGLNSITGELKIDDPYALNLFDYFNYPLIILVQDDSPEPLQATATVNVYVNIDTLSAADKESELLLNREFVNNQFSMNVFPNPARDYFEIELENLEPGLTSILIYNTTGELILQNEFYNSESKFLQKYDVNNYRKGLYMIKIKNNSALYFSKILKM